MKQAEDAQEKRRIEHPNLIKKQNELLENLGKEWEAQGRIKKKKNSNDQGNTDAVVVSSNIVATKKVSNKS